MIQVATLGDAEVKLCKASLDRRLHALRGELLGRVEDGADPSAAAPEVHDLKDQALAGQLVNLRGMARDQLEGEVDAVQAALRRIEQGHYGRCEDCDGSIGRERLLAQPSARRCIRCQQREEQARAAR